MILYYSDFERLTNRGRKDLQDFLVRPNGVTVFVPTNEAFAKLRNLPNVDINNNLALINQVQYLIRLSVCACVYNQCCLSVCLSIHSSIILSNLSLSSSLSLCLSTICVSVRVCVYNQSCLSVGMSVCLAVYLSMLPSILLFLSLSLPLSFCVCLLYVCLSVRLQCKIHFIIFFLN